MSICITWKYYLKIKKLKTILVLFCVCLIIIANIYGQLSFLCIISFRCPNSPMRPAKIFIPILQIWNRLREINPFIQSHITDRKQSWKFCHPCILFHEATTGYAPTKWSKLKNAMTHDRENRGFQGERWREVPGFIAKWIISLARWNCSEFFVFGLQLELK